MIASTTSTTMRIPTSDSFEWLPSSTSGDAVPAWARSKPRKPSEPRSWRSRAAGSRSPSLYDLGSGTRLERRQVFDETGASEAEGEVAWLDEQVELHVTGNGRVAANGEADAAPTAGVTSERASELASDHWRERAVVWRERALAAELVAKVLQRNLNDLHATLEDLRTRGEGHDRCAGAGGGDSPESVRNVAVAALRPRLVRPVPPLTPWPRPPSARRSTVRGRSWTTFRVNSNR